MGIGQNSRFYSFFFFFKYFFIGMGEGTSITISYFSCEQQSPSISIHKSCGILNEPPWDTMGAQPLGCFRQEAVCVLVEIWYPQNEMVPWLFNSDHPIPTVSHSILQYPMAHSESFSTGEPILPRNSPGWFMDSCWKNARTYQESHSTGQ